jgi:hypothetical protein
LRRARAVKWGRTGKGMVRPQIARSKVIQNFKVQGLDTATHR